MDYRAANEYFVQAYGRPFFDQEQPVVDIYNARNGFVVDDKDEARLVPPTIAQCGFTMLENSGAASLEQGMDWTDRDHIGRHYVPIVRDLLKQAYPDDEIAHIIFWNPTLRNSTSLFVGPAHIDTDINAYPDAQSLMDLIYERRIPEPQVQDTSYSKDDWIHALQNGRRFAYVNIWRNLDATTPVQQAPLGLFVPHYNRHNNNAMHTARDRLPHARPNHDQSRWYCYPELTHNEYLLFCQYDRDARQVSDLWHGALTHLLLDDNDNEDLEEEQEAPRSSFDMRCFILFQDEQPLPKEFDRFHSDNKLPNQMATS